MFARELTFSEQSLNSAHAHVRDDHLIGFYTILNLGGFQAELEHIFIDPEFIGKGFGRGLWRHTCELSSSFGAQDVIVRSVPHAAGLYLARGAEYS